MLGITIVRYKLIFLIIHVSLPHHIMSITVHNDENNRILRYNLKHYYILRYIIYYIFYAYFKNNLFVWDRDKHYVTINSQL